MPAYIVLVFGHVVGNIFGLLITENANKNNVAFSWNTMSKNSEKEYWTDISRQHDDMLSLKVTEAACV